VTTSDPDHRDPSSEQGSEIDVRPASEADLPAVLELAHAALGWRPDDPNAAFFRWKHLENPAGRSPMWLATSDGEVVGFRTFLRWRFRRDDGTTTEAVRAVDTATSPDHQRRGIFRRLTLNGVDELAAQGIDFVFNTPNPQSQAGYLKMGWQTVGRVPIFVRPRSLASVTRLAGARAPAVKWSLRSTVGDDAPEVLADAAVGGLLDEVRAVNKSASSSGTNAGLTTDRTIGHLRWRYGFDPLAYRAITLDGDPGRGLAVFRTRARGGAVEAVLCELLVRPGDSAATRQLTAQIARSSGADYLIATGRPIRTLIPVPGRGPVLTWRAIGSSHDAPRLDQWHLTMGDVELF
jgi:GNAT superfamily N-acetyltransferase